MRAFSPAIRAELPFLLPSVAGTVRQGDLITFVYSHIAGKSSNVDDLSTGSASLAMDIGRSIAAIHDLPQDLVTTFDLPSYTANEFRQRKLNELDQAATTGKIPPALLRRWEHAMEDVALWRFNSCVVHGDLHEDNILLHNDAVSAVIGWTDLRVGDPADDFAWLVAVDDHNFVDTVMQAYAAARNETPDPHLLRRAALSAEFALAQWLVKGYAADSARMVEDAEAMLHTLEADIAEHGGQPINAVPPAPPAVAPAPKEPSDAGAPTTPKVAGTGPATEDSDGATPQAAAAEPETAAVAVVKLDAPKDNAPADAPDPEVADAPAAADAAAPADDPKPADAPNEAAAQGTPEDVDTTTMKVIPLDPKQD